jgi:hypothetical protein
MALSQLEAIKTDREQGLEALGSRSHPRTLLFRGKGTNTCPSSGQSMNRTSRLEHHVGVGTRALGPKSELFRPLPPPPKLRKANLVQPIALRCH